MTHDVELAVAEGQPVRRGLDQRHAIAGRCRRAPPARGPPPPASPRRHPLPSPARPASAGPRRRPAHRSRTRRPGSASRRRPRPARSRRAGRASPDDAPATTTGRSPRRSGRSALPGPSSPNPAMPFRAVRPPGAVRGPLGAVMRRVDAADGVAGACPSPVFAVAVVIARKEPSMKKILLAYDGGEPAKRALEQTIELATRFEAEVGVISVVPVSLRPHRDRPLGRPHGPRRGAPRGATSPARGGHRGRDARAGGRCRPHHRARRR